MAMGIEAKSHMDKEVRRLLQTFFSASTEPLGDSCWCPSADVHRGQESWLVKFDLAGVRPEDIRLEAEGRQLRVSGVRRDLSILDNQQVYSMEISYNRFRRSVDLPFDLTQAEIRTEYRDGMLMVLISPRSSR
jgi:HSP20 family protein